MKSIRRLFMFLCCVTLLCAACAPSALASKAPLSIVCTIFPAYDFARQLAGDTAQVRLLLPPGSESHSYEPSPRDHLALSQKLLIIGGECLEYHVNTSTSRHSITPSTSFARKNWLRMLAESE